MTTRMHILFLMLLGIAGVQASACATEECRLTKGKPNPDAPPRSGEGRIGGTAFLKRFGDKKLELVCCSIIPNDDFGTAKPGDTFGGSWLVASKSEKVGINHKSAPWAMGVMVCQVPDGKGGTVERLVPPDRGCGCGGTADYYWTVTNGTPPGRHQIRLTWSWPDHTQEQLERIYTVTIENPNYGKTQDVEIADLQSRFGAEKVVVLQDGALLNEKPYAGTNDLVLSVGGYESAATNIIHPHNRQLGIGYINVNTGSADYSRGLIKFDVSPLQGKKIKQALLKFTIMNAVKYQPSELTTPMAIYPMLKDWAEGERESYHVDQRKLSPGMPNVWYQAFPTKWEKPLASGTSDHGPQAALLEPDTAKNLQAGARADVTELVRSWVSGTLPNYGVIIGADLPGSVADKHPGGEKETFLKLYGSGKVPFYSRDEHTDIDFRPRLIVVCE